MPSEEDEREDEGQRQAMEWHFVHPLAARVFFK